MRQFSCLFLTASALLFPVSVLASGLSKPVLIGPKAIGMGGAFVAVADDPSAIFYNPAGITQLKGEQFLVGVDGLITDLHYTPPTGTPEESAKREFLPVPQFGFTTDRLQPISLGFAVFFPHGNGGKFETPSAVPTNPNEGRIYSLEIDPAIAWKLTDKVSLGAGLRIVRISSGLKGQLIPFNGAVLSLDDLSVSGWTVGASAGLLYVPCRWISFGASYRTEVSSELSGDVTFTGAAPLPATLEQTLPTLVMAGLASHPIEGLTLGLAYGFERNSEIEALTANVTGVGSITLPQNWEDSHTIHLGADYQVLPTLALRAGYAKDLNESIPDAAMNRVVGDIAAHETSLGLAYTWSRYTFSGTWNARFGSRDIPVTATNPAPGNYEAFVQSLSFAVGFGI